MSSDLLTVLEEARKLPVQDRRELASLLLEEISEDRFDNDRRQRAHSIVEETFGSIPGVDRATLIQLAEDEEFCGY